MDYADDNNTSIDEVERQNRTLWVGNLHPKVTHKNIGELFYQIGPVEYVEFAVNEHGVCENFALVVFKYPSSVADGVRLLNGTKLYGMPIETKKYSKQLRDPVFDDQLNYLKQLIDVERNNQSNDCNKSRWNDRSSDRRNDIPDSLPEPPAQHSMYNSYSNRWDDYDRGPESMSSRHQHGNNSYARNHNPGYRSQYDSNDRSRRGREHYQRSERNAASGSAMETSNDDDHQDASFHNHNYDRRNQDYNNAPRTSSNWRESSYRNRESSSVANKNDSANNMPSPGRDLRDIMYGKRSNSDSDHHNRRNASQLDLRDTLYNSKSNKYNRQHYEPSDSNDRWSEKNNQAYGGFSDKQSRRNNYDSERYNESNNRYQNNADKGYYDQSLNKKKTYNNSVQEYNNDYSDNYNDNYSRGKNRPNNYNKPRSQNMEFNSQQQNSGPSFKRKDDGYDRKEYTNSYDERHGHDRSKNYSRGNGQQSRPSYYS